MIMIKNHTTNTERDLHVTIFPDKSSQVWQLDEKILEAGTKTITWYFESEAELFHMSQLVRLLRRSVQIEDKITLVIPFLPYSRQDKIVSNNTTFARDVFLDYLSTLQVSQIVTYDVHSSFPRYCNNWIVSKDVNAQVQKALGACNADLVCFPDKGATTRGYEIRNSDNEIPSFHLDKIRNQTTGKIESLVCSLPLDLEDCNILIVDDICDGGRTFIDASKLLKEMGAKTVSLYVTHGILSQGLHPLFEGGIDHVYTTDSILKRHYNDAKGMTVFKLGE